MKTCANCGQSFEGRISSDQGFVDELGELFLEGTDQDWENDLCPICLEELGMMNLMGFEDSDF